MNQLRAFLPLIVFALLTCLDEAGTKLGTPNGTFTLLGEVFFSAWIAWQIKQRITGRLKALLLAPVSFAVGDLAYGLNHYILQHVYKTSMGPMSYAIPYVVGMVATVYFLAELCKQLKESKKVFLLAHAVSAGVFALNVVLIIVPSLFQKTPPLAPNIATLAVVFSVLESWIVGFSAVLLIVSSSAMLQMILFGLLVMNISDIAIRYQSVYMNLSGMIVFEHGWFFGLALVTTGVLLAVRRSNVEIRAELKQILCFYSIRAMTVGYVLLGLCLVWFAVSMYFKALHVPNEVSATLLIALGIFGFAVIAANIAGRNLSQITFKLAANRQVLRQEFPKHLPEEIKTIVEYFQELNGKIVAERDHTLRLSSTLAHNIKTPASALEMAEFTISQHIRKECACCERLQKPLKLIETSTGAIKNIAEQLLKEKKRLIGLETVASSVKKAVAMAAASHPNHHIIVEAAPESEVTPVAGLTEVLTNLINNAIEASTIDQSIAVTTRLVESNMTIMVSDTGKGIPEKVLSQLRTGKSMTTKIKGNGIGVSSMYAWVKDRGYDVAIESQTNAPATGTSISISIPASLWVEEPLARATEGRVPLWS